MERLSLKPLKGELGTTLIELLIAVAISGIILSSVTYGLQFLMEQSTRIKMRASAESMRTTFIEAILDDRGLSKTLADPANTMFSCLSSPTTCPATDTPLRVTDARGNILYDPSPDQRTRGFSRDGESCDTFSETEPDFNCPFRYDFTWRFICPTCTAKQIEITATLKYRANTSSGGNVNENALSFKLVRNVEAAQNNPDILRLAMSQSAVCAVMVNGKMKCFGLNENGQLGLGDQTNRIAAAQMGNNLPYLDLNGLAVKSLALMNYGTCAILSDDTMRCWGDSQFFNDEGDYGSSPATMGAGLLPITGIFGPGQKPVTLSRFGNWSMCAVMDDGTAWCWTSGDCSGGDPTTCPAAKESLYWTYGTPAQLASRKLRFQFNSPILQAESGGFHICFRVRDVKANPAPAPNAGSNIICWGGKNKDFNYGQIGLGDPNPATDPYPGQSNPADMQTTARYVDLNGRRARSLVTGDLTTCAILNDNSLHCWGRNDFGEMARPVDLTKPDKVANPVEIDLGGPVESVAAGETTLCALLKNGTVKCWGALNGTQSPAVPPTIKDFGGQKVSQINSTFDNYCVVTETQQTYCWNDAAPGKQAFRFHEDHMAYEWEPADDSWREMWLGFSIDPSVYSVVRWFD